MMMRFHRNCYWENISLVSWVANLQKSRQWALWTRYIFTVLTVFEQIILTKMQKLMSPVITFHPLQVCM